MFLKLEKEDWLIDAGARASLGGGAVGDPVRPVLQGWQGTSPPSTGVGGETMGTRKGWKDEVEPVP